MNLILLLGPLVRSLGGTIATSPVDVFFPGADPVEPDILVMLPGSRAAGGGRGVQGPPDLVVEVLSLSTRNHDLVTKRNLYAHGRVREYWFVDPQARTVEILTLDGGRYRSTLTAATADAVTSPVLGDAVFSLTEVFAGIDEETV